MTKLAIIVIVIVIGIVGIYAWTNRAGAPTTENLINSTSTMFITSPSFNNNERIPQKFTCDGGNINPELDIGNVPAGAKSFALIMDDPDAPHGTFTHWLVWNIDPEVTNIGEDSIPSGSVEGKNDSGRVGYIGPCPPSGIHHYHFIIYALSAIIDLKSGSDKKLLETEIDKYLIARVDLVGLYQRK
jgi:Raf kinase inhibitor-like YbhB/YbcL family protein